MKNMDIDELIALLINRILEHSKSPEQAKYYADGVIARFADIDWAVQVNEALKSRQASIEAMNRFFEQRDSEYIECAQCYREIRRGDSIRLDEPPKYRYQQLCPECAQEIQQEFEIQKNRRFTHECALCGIIYETSSSNGRLCVSCDSNFNRRELNRVNSHLRRAQKLGLDATLTLRDWLNAIDEFGGLCSYCQSRPHQVLEHFIPLLLGGGTTAGNCIPACKECNAAKHQKHPKDSTIQFKQLNMLRIQHYLEIQTTTPT